MNLEKRAVFLKLFLSASALEGILAFVALLIIPTSSTNSLLVGFSGGRIAMLLSTLVATTTFLHLLQAATYRRNWLSRTEGKLDAWMESQNIGVAIVMFLVLILPVLILIISAILLFKTFLIPEDTNYNPYLIRLSPLVAWTAIMSIQAIALLILPRINLVSYYKLIAKSVSQFLYDLRQKMGDYFTNSKRQVILAYSITRKRIRWSLQAKTLFAISSAVVTLAFLIPRIPFFVDYPLPVITHDSASYFAPVRQIFSSQWPDFTIRTPGYPLFLAATLLVLPRLMFVIVLQNLLTLASVLFLLWAIHRAHGWLVIGAAVAMIAHVTQPLLSGHDFLLMTESLFSSLLLFCLGFLILAINTRQPRHFLLFSVLGGYAILVRPAGIFLLGGLLISLLYLVLNQYSLKSILCLALPMPAMIVLLMTYNYAFAGHFMISNLAALSLYGQTATYWEPDEAFPDAVNAGIQKFLAEIPEADQQILDTSWDYAKLTPLFANAGRKAVYLYQYGVFHVTPELSFYERMALAEQVGQKAISSHPEMYLKSFWANLVAFLVDPSSWRAYYYNDIAWIAYQMYIEGIAADEFIGREYVEMPAIPNLRLEGDGENRQFVVVPTLLSNFYFKVAGLLGRIFNHRGWLVAYVVILLSSLFIAIRSRFHHQGAFIVLAMSSLLAGAGVAIALTTTMVNRYPSPTRFIEVLSVAFLPLLFRQVISERIQGLD